MKLSRRGMMAGSLFGALAVPTVAGLASWQWKTGGNSLLLHDDSLIAGRRFADAGRAAGATTRAIHGDPVRFGREVLASKPALVAGVSRHAEALLLGEVAMEEGYVLATELRGCKGACEGFTLSPGWNALNRVAASAGGNWVELLAAWAANPQASELPQVSRFAAASDPGTVLGWVLVPRA